MVKKKKKKKEKKRKEKKRFLNDAEYDVMTIVEQLYLFRSVLVRNSTKSSTDSGEGHFGCVLALRKPLLIKVARTYLYAR